MWKFKPFSHRESASLEGRSIDVGNLKVHVKNPIAEGGFSCVYLARDAVHSNRQYALKHIICNDGESLELVMKEISVMKLLKGHPNITKLVSYAIMDMGRTKEALLVMEFCDRSLVTFLENGADFFEEKHILLIFRDVCNAVFSMHCQHPPIAHRDLKAENVLLGADGAWKLCDFGSTSCNHKCFTKPEEMGIEEDNIRKHTTPSYRAPEMWDLYRKDVISEKVDIWALGCLLYRICYLKSAFDGESKLQIINVNYHIPELPRYSASLIGLMKDLIQGSPDARPDITQVWFHVNELLPLGLQKHLPENSSSTIDMHPPTAKLHQEGVTTGVNTIPQMISRPPASKEHGQWTTTPSNKETQQPKPSQSTAKANRCVVQIGSFWSTQHGQGSNISPGSQIIHDKAPPKEWDHEIMVSKREKKHTSQRINPLNTERFLGENKSTMEEQSSEVSNLMDQLKQANLEKAEISSKYEKLIAICQSQRNEIHELKRSLAATTTSFLSKDNSKSQISPASLQSTTLVQSNVKKFRYCGINPELEKKLDQMFRGVVAIGNHAWATTQSIHKENSNDLIDEPAHVTEDLVESSFSRRSNLLSAKGAMKKKKGAVFLREQISQLVSVCSSMFVEEKIKPVGGSIAEAIKVLEQIEEVFQDVPLYLFATELLEDANKREVFMNMASER